MAEVVQPSLHDLESRIRDHVGAGVDPGEQPRVLECRAFGLDARDGRDLLLLVAGDPEGNEERIGLAGEEELVDSQPMTPITARRSVESKRAPSHFVARVRVGDGPEVAGLPSRQRPRPLLASVVIGALLLLVRPCCDLGLVLARPVGPVDAQGSGRRPGLSCESPPVAAAISPSGGPEASERPRSSASRPAQGAVPGR